MSDDRCSDSAAVAPSTEVTALALQVAAARDKLPLQHDTALYEALSDDEIRAERELAEWIRAKRRKQRRQAVVDEMAADKRDRRTGSLIRRTDEADARWHRQALAARRRVSSADARLAQLYRRAEWSSRALIGVVILGMVWAGVNVQHNLVPSGDMSDPLYWLSFGIEAMISIPIIVIMVAATTAARWGRELERGKVLLFELTLLGTTVALNAGPHLASGSFGRAAEFAIAPVMVGVVIWLHAWVSARYAMLIESASVELPGDAGYSPSERAMSPAPDRALDGSGSATQRLSINDQPTETAGVDHAAADQIAPRATAPTTDPAITQAEMLAAERAYRQALRLPINDQPTETPAASVDPAVAEAETIAASAAERAYREALRRPVADKPAVPGNLGMIRKAAADHRRNGTDHVIRTNGAAPAVRRIPVGAKSPAGDATGTDPVPEATMHAGTVARDLPGDTSPPTEPLVVHNDPPAEPEQLTLATEPAEQLALDTVPAPRKPVAPKTRRIAPAEPTAPRSAPEATAMTTPESVPVAAKPESTTARSAPESAMRSAATNVEPTATTTPESVPVADDPEPTADPIDFETSLDESDEDPSTADEFDYDDDTEVRALARQIAHRSPLRLTLDQIEEILELTDQSWSARSIGSEVGVPSSTVTNIVEFAHKIRQPYAFTG
ncbi:hypothetical protein [Nocardia sp. NPDC058666]|uniref:helix-turn-helix domain-containing protein n=1 Tax=unclassified Nocardia TaxID=2637762 RepID=UPI003663551D